MMPILMAFLFEYRPAVQPCLEVADRDLGMFFLEPILIDPLMGLAGGWVAQSSRPSHTETIFLASLNSLNNLPERLGGAISGGTTQTRSVTHAGVMLGIYIVVCLPL